MTDLALALQYMYTQLTYIRACVQINTKGEDVNCARNSVICGIDLHTTCRIRLTLRSHSGVKRKETKGQIIRESVIVLYNRTLINN